MLFCDIICRNQELAVKLDTRRDTRERCQTKKGGICSYLLVFVFL